MDLILRNKCIKCIEKNKIIHKEFNVPISFTVTNNNKNYKYSTLEFGYCKKCNIIQLNKLIDLNILYEKGHNFSIIGNTWKQYFSKFIKLLNPHINKKNILEIGCPSGKLAKMCTNYNLWNIIDPNVKEIKKKGVNCIPNFFNEDTKFKFKIDIIVHSHLFEHIYYPIPFLKNCYNILEDNGYMIFGIPNMEYIMQNKLSLYFGIMFEHNIFYSVENIISLLEQVGFSIIDINYYKNHSIFFKVKKIKSNIIKFKSINKHIDKLNLEKIFLQNIIYYEKKIIEWVNYLKGNSKPIYIFGASYNNSLLIHKISNRFEIKGILDNCKEKQGKYFYGYIYLIYSPKILEEEDSIVILKNGVYVKEIEKQIMKLNKNTILLK